MPLRGAFAFPCFWQVRGWALENCRDVRHWVQSDQRIHCVRRLWLEEDLQNQTLTDWIVLAQASVVPGMWGRHLLEMQLEELGAVLGFNPDGSWAWSDEIFVKGSRTWSVLFSPKNSQPASCATCEKELTVVPLLPEDHLHSGPSGFVPILW